MTLIKRQYRHPDGRIFSIGIGLPKRSPGGKWTTYWRWPGVDGSTRYTSVMLPWRDTKEQAQADLDAWALQYGRYKGPRVKEVMPDV